MKYIINAAEPFHENLIDNLSDKEILQNIYTLLNTVKKEVPMYRDFGINIPDIRATPLNIAETTLAADIYAAVEKYEPRAEIAKIDFTADYILGKLIPVLEINVKGE